MARLVGGGGGRDGGCLPQGPRSFPSYSCCFLSASSMSSLATTAVTVAAAVIDRAVRGSWPRQTQ